MGERLGGAARRPAAAGGSPLAIAQRDGAGGGRAGAVEVGQHLADDALDDGAADLAVGFS